MAKSTADWSPMGIWQEWLEKGGEMWSNVSATPPFGPDAVKGVDGLFKAWSDSWVAFLTQTSSPELLQKGMAAWTENMQTLVKALTGAAGTGAIDPYQMWRQWFAAWSDSWVKFLAGAPSL